MNRKAKRNKYRHALAWKRISLRNKLWKDLIMKLK